jgi:DNA-directed RNA polymerase subunit M/transcription elongation factor TFIIS
MVEFCPECSNLLRKEFIDGKSTLVCKCGFQQKLEQN